MVNYVKLMLHLKNNSLESYNLPASPNEKPFKQGLNQVGSDRIDEIADPEIAIERAISTYRKKGYSEDWITQRIRSIELRKDLSAEWNRVGVEERLEYVIFSNRISKASLRISISDYKKFKEF